MADCGQESLDPGNSKKKKMDGGLPADVARKALRSSEGWYDPDVDLGFAEGRRVSRERDVRRLHQLASPAEGQSVDGSDDRLRKGHALMSVVRVFLRRWLFA